MLKALFKGWLKEQNQSFLYDMILFAIPANCG